MLVTLYRGTLAPITCHNCKGPTFIPKTHSVETSKREAIFVVGCKTCGKEKVKVDRAGLGDAYIQSGYSAKYYRQELEKYQREQDAEWDDWGDDSEEKPKPSYDESWDDDDWGDEPASDPDEVKTQDPVAEDDWGSWED